MLQLAGTGDELQGIKRGIMEMADGIAINKCDGNNIERSMLAKAQFQSALHLFPLSDSGWTPEVIPCSSIDKNGIPEIWDMIMRYISFVRENQYFDLKRNQQSKYWMYESINEYLRTSFYHNHEIQKMISQIEKKILNNEMSSFVGAKTLLDMYHEQRRK